MERRFKRSAAALMFHLISCIALQLQAEKKNAALKHTLMCACQKSKIMTFLIFFHIFNFYWQYFWETIPTQHNVFPLTGNKSHQIYLFNWRTFSICFYYEVLPLYLSATGSTIKRSRGSYFQDISWVPATLELQLPKTWLSLSIVLQFSSPWFQLSVKWLGVSPNKQLTLR